MFYVILNDLLDLIVDFIGIKCIIVIKINLIYCLKFGSRFVKSLSVICYCDILILRIIYLILFWICKNLSVFRGGKNR